MKKFILSAIIALATATSSFAQFSDPNFTFTADSKMSGSTISFPSTSVSIPSTTTVSGYFKDNGTYVDSYVRTRPNSTNWDNFSTSGNTNLYTGSTGYRAKDYSVGAYNYGSGNVIHTGPRGGQYYINSNGRKTYVPKRRKW